MGDEMINRLYDEYVVAFKAGKGSPRPFLDQLQGDQKAELQLLIDVFLDRAPESHLDESAYRDSFSAKMSTEVAASLAGTSGQLPVVLVGLRSKLRITVSSVERQLAERLGAKSSREEEQVRDYYHQLEFGTLPAKPVSDKVFDALAEIYRTSAAKLRAAGEALGPQHDHLGGPVYARVAGVADKGQPSPALSPGSARKGSSSEDFETLSIEQSLEQNFEQATSRERSHIDELFLGESA